MFPARKGNALDCQNISAWKSSDQGARRSERLRRKAESSGLDGLETPDTITVDMEGGEMLAEDLPSDNLPRLRAFQAKPDLLVFISLVTLRLRAKLHVLMLHCAVRHD